MRGLRARLRADDGFTMIELIVVSLLAVLVLTTVGGVYVSTVGVQQVVGTMNQTTTDGQIAARSIDGGVRNGSEFEITTLPSGDQLLRVRSLDGTESGVWHCRAWYFASGGEGAIRTRTVADDTVIPVPTAAEVAGWTLLVEGIRPSTGTTIFSPDPTFETVLAVDFTTEGEDGANAARIKFSTPLMPESTEEGSCF